jgi:hypothetical protein
LIFFFAFAFSISFSYLYSSIDTSRVSPFSTYKLIGYPFLR